MTVRFVFALASALFLVIDGALAGPKEDVAAATARWAETLAQNDPDKVVGLYASDAVLWERSRRQCDQIERRSATISSERSRSCPD